VLALRGWGTKVTDVRCDPELTLELMMPEISPNIDANEDRRKFLATCGKFAVITPPAITALLSTSLHSTAIASSGGGIGRSSGGIRRSSGGIRRSSGGIGRSSGGWGDR
jgi:uncharacterized membrane protein